MGTGLAAETPDSVQESSASSHEIQFPADAGAVQTISGLRDSLEALEASARVLGRPGVSTSQNFSVSPDELWVVVFVRSLVLLAHIPSGRVWEHALSVDPTLSADPTVLRALPKCFPNCFSIDSSMVHFWGLAAELSPDMPSIAPREHQSEEPLDSLSSLNTEVDYQKRRYEAARQGQVEADFLISSPPRSRRGVSYEKVLTALERRLEEGIAELLVALDAEPVSSRQEEAIKGFIEWLRSRLRSPRVRLENLSISPDGRLLAATAGVNGNDFVGVVVPLDRGGLLARPFAFDAGGTVVWSRDSTRLYFYAGGTIHRLEVDRASLSKPVPEVQLSEALLNAPTDAEIRTLRYEQRKVDDYARLKVEFEEPQTIVEVWHANLYLASGFAVDLHGLRGTPGWVQRRFERYAKGHILGRPLEVRLPALEEFKVAYIPGMRGRFHGEGYPRRDCRTDICSNVPVLIFDDGVSINDMFIEPFWRRLRARGSEREAEVIGWEVPPAPDLDCSRSVGIDLVDQELFTPGLRSGEGQRFRFSQDMVIKGIYGLFWRVGHAGVLDAIVYRGEYNRERLQWASVPIASLPPYEGKNSERRLTYFELSPPLEFAAEEYIQVLFDPTYGDVAAGLVQRPDRDKGGFISSAPRPAGKDLVAGLCLTESSP